jgi:hypothetical protein
VCGEGRLRLTDEAGGLRGVEAAGDGHDPFGGDMAGLDGKHGVFSSFEGGLDVADDKDLIRVVTVHALEDPVEAGDDGVVVCTQLLEDTADLGQGSPGTSQEAAQLAGADLVVAIGAVAVGGLDVCRAQQAHALVDPQALTLNRERLASSPIDRNCPGKVVVHTTIVASDQGARSSDGGIRSSGVSPAGVTEHRLSVKGRWARGQAR